MKKILRMALVLVLAGSALLYTSCTKDYSPDIKSLQDQINDLNNGPEGLAWVKQQLQTVQTNLSNLEGKVNNDIAKAISDLDTKITAALADKADKTAFLELKEDFDELADLLMNEETGKIPEIEAAIAALTSGSDAIATQFSEYAEFIQSMAYVPATSDGKIEVISYNLVNADDADYSVVDHVDFFWLPGVNHPDREPGAWDTTSHRIRINGRWVYIPVRAYGDTTWRASESGGLSQPLLVASFKVTPPEAVERVSAATANLVAVQTKSAAAAPDTLNVTKLLAREDAPGYVDVYAIPGKVEFDPNSFAVALCVTYVSDDDLVESVTSDYAHAYVAQGSENIKFEIFDNKNDEIVDPQTEDDPVKVYPSSDPDSVNVFTAGRWSVVASFAGSYLTPAEAKDVFGVKDIKLVSPKKGDTIVAPVAVDAAYYAWKDYGFESTVWPAGEKKVKDLINDNNGAHSKFQLALNLANSHMIGTGTDVIEPSGKVIATYQATPDVKKLALTPEHPVVIPWDYKYYNDINDTLIAKIWVAGDRNKLIGNGDSPLGKKTPTWNKDTEVDYTQGTGAVTPHTNDSKAIDVNLLSAANYGKVDSTYVYSIQQYNAEEATMYVGEFDYVVKARPADVEVELGPVDTMVCFASDITFNVEPIYKAIKAHAEAYAPFDTADVYPAFAAGLTKKAAKVTLDGKEVKGQSATFNVVYDGAAKKDASTLATKINKVGQYKISVPCEFAGVKYTFVLTVNATNNPAKIAPKAAYVTVDNAETKDYSVEVKGDVDTTAGAANRYHYFLKDMPVKDYLKVVDYAETSEELKIDLKTVTKMVAGNEVTPEFTTPIALARLNEDKTVANLGNDANYKWNTYDSLQFAVAAVLFPVADNTAKVDSATVRLWTKNPIPVFNGGKVLVVEHEKDQLASANIAANLEIKDLNGIALNDSTGLRAIGYDAKAKEVVVNYDQTLQYANIEDIKVISGAQYIEELLLSWGPAGVLNLQLNQGTIVEPIILEVPVTLTHMLDRGLGDAVKTTVTVKFIEKGSAPAGE